MTNTLGWSVNHDGIRFQVSDPQGHPVPMERWGAAPVLTGGGTGTVAPLLALYEDGADGIILKEDGALRVVHETAARWDRVQARQLGLPEISPYRIHIRGEGVLTSPRFRFVFQLQDGRGHPPMGATRKGVILTVGSRTYLLLDPIYSLVETMEAFNRTPEADVDRRFEIWGQLKSLLPEDAVVDQHLCSLNIVRADAITLDALTDDEFQPVLLARQRPMMAEGELGGEADPELVLPSLVQKEFGQRFRDFGRAQRRYAVAGNWYVMVPESLKDVLQVVREVLDGSPAERRAFLADPHAQLKARLGEKVPADAIDELFQETPAFISARVQQLGEWNPKAQAFVPTGATEWLPEDVERGSVQRVEPSARRVGAGTEIRVKTSGGVVALAVKDAPAVIDRLRVATAEGAGSITWDGQVIPADVETLHAFERLAGARGRGVSGMALVPIILDNLESVGYEAAPRLKRGQVGGRPAVLRADLFAHQREGLEWLQAHWAAGSPGALLADDMGLGKTVQTLAFLAWVQEQTEASGEPRKPHLIVAPTGLLGNWEAEAQVHLDLPGLGRLQRAYGPELKDLARRPALERRAFLQDQIDWVLTTYETLRDKIRLFADLPWRVVVFDEAQKIKNPASRMTDMAKSLAADFTVALTGTPVENSLSDLWCIMDAVHPGLLGSHAEYKRTYAKPAVDDPGAATPIKRKLEEEVRPPALLRRMKEDHLRGLPQKHQQREERTMPAAQAQAYDRVVAQARATIGGADNNRGAMLEALHGLRQVSLLPESVGPEGVDDNVVRSSARLSVLMEILDRIHIKREKALIFVEFLNLQEALIPYLRQRYDMSWDPLRINGGVPGPRRQEHVKAFQDPCRDNMFDVMLLSPKAAGVGLTLTAANHVVHLSRWWNPAVEDQCTDRVYRIGQSREVHVYFPIAVHPEYREHSFDFNLDHLLQRKRRLSRAVLAPPVAGDDDLRELLDASVR